MTLPRHSANVRITHWIAALCFFALLVTGINLVISHPRFYWGEEGNVNTPALFQIPIPASRAAVQTGYRYVLPDQNGWSRSLHFQAAWLVVFAGLAYGLHGLRSGHFRRNLLPAASDLKPAVIAAEVSRHLRWSDLRSADASNYNLLQRIAYAKVVFFLFPLMIWTGLAMSPTVVGAWPVLADSLGGHQSARTIHFFATLGLVLFLLVHVAMIAVSGFRSRMKAMVTGGVQ